VAGLTQKDKDADKNAATQSEVVALGGSGVRCGVSLG
jgi:hypothetical protein